MLHAFLDYLVTRDESVDLCYQGSNKIKENYIYVIKLSVWRITQ